MGLRNTNQGWGWLARLLHWAIGGIMIFMLVGWFGTAIGEVMDKSQSALLEWKDGGIPVSTRFDDPYFSMQNGLAETRHVFLAGNDLPARFHPLDSALGFSVALIPLILLGSIGFPVLDNLERALAAPKSTLDLGAQGADACRSR